uniref:Phenylalanine--tRNA ligase alpha subunit n=1 Tax=uncultured delta proteobacterium TaxID=34034 RepID=Q2YZU5_9DELT|nr:Phenylalanyl-tRNA synthetase alpha subunit [uncultured delta proteobacterium]
MIKEISEIRDEALQKISQADDAQALKDIKSNYLGRKGRLTQILKGVGSLSSKDKPIVGKLANEVKVAIDNVLKNAEKSILEKRDIIIPVVDITLPGRRLPSGHVHPITRIAREISQIFSRLGFHIEEGPEIELDFYNFEALNIPLEHPARDMQDTFYISDNIVLRTHTSPIQIRTMEKQKPPLKIIAPGKTYRCDSDITHTPMFHQVEGLMVDKDITFGDLKGILTLFIHQIFYPEVKLRFRPSFFPFTEPSAEVDMACVMCKGKGCRVCSNTGWIEILGCGLVDPEVFKAVDYDPEEYTGFAFGMGVERIAMLKYGIDDLRLFYDNDIRFLSQF